VGQDNRTALAMIIADELELEVAPGRVRLVMGDTDVCRADPGTFGSRSLPDAGEDLCCCAATARELLAESCSPVVGEDASCAQGPMRRCLRPRAGATAGIRWLAPWRSRASRVHTDPPRI